MQSDEVTLSKAAIVERCIKRIREEYEADPELGNFTHLDALLLNIERACQACIDLSMHICAKHRLGIPQSSAEAFSLLERGKIIDADIADKLRRMTAFRNRAVHQYQELDKDVVHWIVKKGIQDWVAFCESMGAKIQSE